MSRYDRDLASESYVRSCRDRCGAAAVPTLVMGRDVSRSAGVAIGAAENAWHLVGPVMRP